MNLEPKKVSLEFRKIIKKFKEKPPEDRQFIDCLEGKSIKVKGGEIVEEKKPLVIPLKDKTTTAASLLRIAQEVESGINENEEVKKEESTEVHKNLEVPVNESLEARAVRELLEDVNKKNKTDVQDQSSKLVIPAVDNIKITGEKESNLDDYENIPIAEFGMAMLRGMGWAPGKGMGKHKAVDAMIPVLRPKGMGLGADKIVIRQENGENNSKKIENEELKLAKNSFVKIIAGKHINTYGQISGFDEDSGRLIVKAAIGGAFLNLNEFMVQVVTKDEYQKNSKVLNVAKYEEYKQKTSTNEKKNSKDNYDQKYNSSSKFENDKYNRSEEQSYYNSSKYEKERERDNEREGGKDNGRGRERDIERERERDNEREGGRDNGRGRERDIERERGKNSDRGRGREHERERNRDIERERNRDYEREDERSYKLYHRDRKEERHRRYYDSSSDSSSEKRNRDKKRKGKKKKRDRSRSNDHRRY